jgi:hypothetical protein
LKILLATPAYGGVVTTAYHNAVMKTLVYFQREFPGIEFETAVVSISMLVMARNILASRVLNDPTFTHLLFIDSDMGFQPSLIAKMLAQRKPVVGIVAPMRRLDYEAYHKAREKAENPMIARLIGNDYVAGEGAVKVNTLADGTRQIDVVDGFVQVSHTGTGIMLVERQVLEGMRERYERLWVADPPPHIRGLGLPTGGLLQCFEQARDHLGIALGEDVSFCLRWTQDMGGEIWANIDEGIIHVGSDNYTGHYLTKLQHSDVRLNFLTAEQPDEPEAAPSA